MGAYDKNTSPDMVKFSDVINILTNDSKYYKSEKEMAILIRQISSLPKYDYKTVSDNITNNNTTVNVIAETSKVREFLMDLKANKVVR